MIFRKKNKGAEDLRLDDEDIIDFEEFEAIEDLDEDKKEDLKEEEVRHHFIFHIKEGCPICGSDVRGNDYFKYFCEKCNVLFDKKDVIESEFGTGVKKAGVRRTMLTDDERAALDKKRKELSERIFRTFSEEKKAELKEEAEAREEKEESGQEPEEVDAEEIEAEVIPAYAADEDEPVEDKEPRGLEQSLEHMQEKEQQEEEPEEEDAKEEKPALEKVEYALEGNDKIIASRESDRMHVGSCHFVKKIHPDNRIYLDSVEQGEENGYQLCVCLRRLRARTRLE